jgi:hypothetical protein
VALLNGADAASLATSATTEPVTPASAQANPLPYTYKKQSAKPVKGDKRILVQCDDVETLIFGSRFDPDKTHGRRRNRAKRTLSGDGAENDVSYGNVVPAGEDRGGDITDATDGTDGTDGTASVPTTDDEEELDAYQGSGGVPLSLPDRSRVSPPSAATPVTTTTPSTTETPPPTNRTPAEMKAFEAKDFGAGKVRPSQLETELNFSAMGGERGWAEKLEETDEMREKRLAGETRARQREQVRCAARRLVAFGWQVAVQEEAEEEGNSKGKGGKKKNKKGKRGGDSEEEEESVGKAAGVSTWEKGEKTMQKKCEAIMAGVAVESSFAKGMCRIFKEDSPTHQANPCLRSIWYSMEGVQDRATGSYMSIVTYGQIRSATTTTARRLAPLPHSGNLLYKLMLLPDKGCTGIHTFRFQVLISGKAGHAASMTRYYTQRPKGTLESSHTLL